MFVSHRVNLIFMDLDSINNMQWWRIQKWKNQTQIFNQCSSVILEEQKNLEFY